MAVHARPAAFEGVDGFSYSVDILTDTTGEPGAPWGAYLFFVKWGHGEPEVQGHRETDFLVRGNEESVVRHQLGAMQLATVKATLDGLLRGPVASRPWWDVAATDGDDDGHAERAP